MKLSIIVPVYNMAAEGKLEYCMDSLLKQTIEDYEIIAVDDASKDRSPEILREYERRFPGRVKALFHETLSPIHISEPTRQAEISYSVFCF